MPSECYYYKEITLNNRHKTITDVAIVLTMSNKTLDDENIKQIIDKTPAKKLVIQFNKGFTNCDKQHLIEQKSNYDLCDATKTALHYAFNVLKEDNVLILEDDAYFVNDIDEDIAHIKEFIRQENFSIYNLGPVGFVANPFNVLFDKKHVRVYTYFGSHACVYHKTFLTNFEMSKCSHIDLYSQYARDCFIYHKPLCLQFIHNHSSNSAEWPIVGKFAFLVINILGLFDEYPPKVKDFNTLHTISKVLSIVLLILLVFITVYGFMWLSHR
jgi:hypothetical protein